jgi:hypothetical protein
MAHLVTGFRRFQLHDFGAHIALTLSAEWPGDELAHFDHPIPQCATADDHAYSPFRRSDW